LAEALIICRFLQFCAVMLLFGISVFIELIVPAGLRADLRIFQRRLSFGLILLILVTAVAWLALQAGEIGDGWSFTIDAAILSSVVSDTEFGQVWIWRLVIAALLLATMPLRGTAKKWSVIIISASLLASLGLVGHAAMQEGLTGWAHRLNHSVHLLSAGFWLGSLLPLLLCLGLLRVPALRRDALLALSRFSGIGHVAVALILATGIVNTEFTLGKPWTDLTSPYQALLATKIGLVCLMILSAIINRYVFVPRLASDGSKPLRAIALGTIGEMILGALIIALVSAFATFDPM
jgi:putative copper resistance protein D